MNTVKCKNCGIIRTIEQAEDESKNNRAKDKNSTTSYGWDLRYKDEGISFCPQCNKLNHEHENQLKNIETTNHHMKVNILGADYDFVVDKAENDPKLIDNMGYCDNSIKYIGIKDKTEYALNDVLANKDFNVHLKETKRHEIIHAFFSECGLTDYNENEQLVDWIAIQFPKIVEVFQKANAL
jgi:hypothetical protein